MSEKLYNKLLKEIHGCADCHIKNEHGVVIGVGMEIKDDLAFINMLDEDCIILQHFNSNERLVTLTPDGKVLEAFKLMFENLSMM